MKTVSLVHFVRKIMVVAGVASLGAIANAPVWAQQTPETEPTGTPADTEVIPEPTPDPATDSVTDPTFDPATDPAVDPATDPAADPTIDSTTEPVPDSQITPDSQPAPGTPVPELDGNEQPTPPTDEGGTEPTTPVTPTPGVEGTPDADAVDPAAEPEADLGDTSNLTIAEIANNAPSFSTLAQAIEAAGLADTLAAEGPYTVFAPTNEAFSELPPGTLNYLLQPENQELLQQVLQYHVASTELPSSEIATGGISTLNGGLAAQVLADRIVINDASVIQPDIEASNGVIHGINRVLMPRELREQIAAEVNAQ